jgi:hypothetical protein
MAIEHENGTIAQQRNQLAKTKLLILDDFGVAALGSVLPERGNARATVGSQVANYCHVALHAVAHRPDQVWVGAASGVSFDTAPACQIQPQPLISRYPNSCWSYQAHHTARGCDPASYPKPPYT